MLIYPQSLIDDVRYHAIVCQLGRELSWLWLKIHSGKRADESEFLRQRYQHKD
ncbi:MAG: hypothetical protein JO235_12610 [Chroococcidiopsidaceae cyanobacterium CP_BM_RX_35]|nr:hypothetical protein [Chroococcidiopsidaceae cyanobacterium CP_BM_RX_35]